MIDYYMKTKEINELDNIQKNEENNEKENNQKNKNGINMKDILFYSAHFLLIIIGIITVIFQFVPINFFNIVLKE